MGKIFAPRRGQLVPYLQDVSADLGRISVPGLKENINSAVLIESYAVRQGTAHQFQPSLSRAVYVYIFGDQMGQIEIRGLAAAISCQKGGTGGLKEILDFYSKNRASQTPTLTVVTVGTYSFRGFLTGLNISPRSPEHLLSNWALQIATLPNPAPG